MKRRVSSIQLAKFDVNQKIIQELADFESRTILFSIKTKARLAEEISYECKIPVSSVYKKLRDLQNLALIFVERWELSERGRRMKFYKSRISQAEIRITKNTPELVLVPNKKGKHQQSQ